MTHPVRALFVASLACLLAPFALPERAAPAEAVTAPGVAASPVRHEAHPGPEAARLRLPDLSSDRSTDSPLSGRSTAFATASTVAATAVMASPPVTTSAALDRLPPCRGPPALA